MTKCVVSLQKSLPVFPENAPRAAKREMTSQDTLHFLQIAIQGAYLGVWVANREYERLRYWPLFIREGGAE